MSCHGRLCWSKNINKIINYYVIFILCALYSQICTKFVRVFFLKLLCFRTMRRFDDFDFFLKDWADAAQVQWRKRGRPLSFASYDSVNGRHNFSLSFFDIPDLRMKLWIKVLATDLANCKLLLETWNVFARGIWFILDTYMYFT